MTRAEARTERARGSEYPRTFEDAAQEIAEDGGSRGEAVGAALGEYQAALNALLELAAARDLHGDLARMWARSRTRAVQGLGIDPAEVQAEVLWILRRLVSLWDPEAGSLRNYCNRATFRALDVWLSRRGSPVELSTHAAREVRGAATRAALDSDEVRHHRRRAGARFGGAEDAVVEVVEGLRVGAITIEQVEEIA